MNDRQFEDCIERILCGERSGLKDIYEEYGRLICGTVMNVVKSPHDAEDVTSDFFIRLWSIADTYAGGKGHRRWLTVIARNMAIDFLRRKSRELPTDDDDESCLNETPSGEKLEESITEKVSLSEALNILEDTEREIIHLKFAAELTFAEIAKILKKPQGTVSWKYRKAIEKLRRCIPDERFI